jgi:hypothetical protein
MNSEKEERFTSKGMEKIISSGNNRVRNSFDRDVCSENIVLPGLMTGTQRLARKE